jgi:hypothetical protein
VLEGGSTSTNQYRSTLQESININRSNKKRCDPRIFCFFANTTDPADFNTKFISRNANPRSNQSRSIEAARSDVILVSSCFPPALPMADVNTKFIGLNAKDCPQMRDHGERNVNMVSTVTFVACKNRELILSPNSGPLGSVLLSQR